jgi:hypothetical protein
MTVPCLNPEPSVACLGGRFDEDSGTGVPTWIDNLLEEICPPCGFPEVVEELENREQDYKRIKELWPTINFSEIDRLLTDPRRGAKPKAALWLKVQGFALTPPKPQYYRQVEAALAQAHEDSRRAYWRLREIPIEDGAEQARGFIDREPTEISQDPTQVEGLIDLRKETQEAIATAERNLESSRRPRMQRDRRIRVLKRGNRNIRVALLRARRYMRAETKIERERKRREEEREGELVDQALSATRPVGEETTSEATLETAEVVEEVEEEEEAE